MQRFRFYTFFLILGLFFGCTSDKALIDSENCDEVITYNNQVKIIINNTCAYAGCHVTGFSSGNFTSYTGLKPYLENGRFSARAILQKNMPPLGVPDGKPESLTNDQIKTLNCWEQGGFLLE